jgi:hypothetical protein
LRERVIFSAESRPSGVPSSASSPAIISPPERRPAVVFPARKPSAAAAAAPSTAAAAAPSTAAAVASGIPSIASSIVTACSIGTARVVRRQSPASRLVQGYASMLSPVAIVRGGRDRDRVRPLSRATRSRVIARARSID